MATYTIRKNKEKLYGMIMEGPWVALVGLQLLMQEVTKNEKKKIKKWLTKIFLSTMGKSSSK